MKMESLKKLIGKLLRSCNLNENMKNGEFVWKGKDKKISELTDTEILEIYFIRKISPFLTLITKYFPFSLLWQDRRFHYRFKDVVEMDDLITKTCSEKGFWFKFLTFERYNKLLVIVGKFIPIKEKLKKDDLIQHLKSVFSNRNIYISEQDKGTIKFSIINRDK